MPNDWIMGSVTAVFVDAMDHVWVTHLPETLTPEETSAVQDPPIGMCCVPAPIVIEFDEERKRRSGMGGSDDTRRVGVPTKCAWAFCRPQRLRLDRELPTSPGDEIYTRR